MTRDELWERAWAGIAEGVRSRKSAFRTFAVATAEPDARIVVLRSAQPEEWIQFHTDRRSSKVAVIERDARCAALFYDPAGQIQVRLRCQAEIRAADEAAWQATALLARRCYLAKFGPGSPISEPEEWIEPKLQGRAPSVEEAEAGRANFAAVRLHIESAEVLKLDYEAHRRAAYSRTAEGWQGRWLSA